MNVEEGQEVQIARNGLPYNVGFEYSVATVYETDVDADPGIHQRVKLGSPQRRRRAHTLLEHVLGARGGNGGPVVEVATHRDPDKHSDATYHHVYMEDGGQGIFPESCLVKMPRDVLGGEPA